MAGIIHSEYGGKVPKDLASLIKLPGVGRKTANCVLVYAYEKPAIPVDIHVHRISNRLGLVSTKTPEETESSFGEISRALPDVTLYKYNLDVKTHAGVIVVAAVDDAEKIQRVMRGVNASAIVIPPEFPQTPNKAYTLAVDQIKKLEKKQSENTKQMTAFTKKNRSEILALHERCTVAKDVLEHLRKPGGTKRFAVIRGYIPSKMEEKFKKSA